ncbi:MAG TPA: CRISPR-associated endonuclease Cas2 [Beijerinckiaceae bacterium]|nr:CRISPR-associated endonuclease Cas2 [Beijerinckiaceae bacterium]
MAHARPVPQLPWGWRSMWVIAMFDLPTETPNMRKAYARFRKTLLEDGFTMMQYSVYSRHCANIENAELHVRRMGDRTPAQGEVRFLTITDRQFGRIKVFVGKKRQPSAPSPSQLQLL